MCVRVFVCVWLTTNGVVVRHQVLSPVDQDRGQTHGRRILHASIMAAEHAMSLKKYMLFSSVGTSDQMESSGGVFPHSGDMLMLFCCYSYLFLSPHSPPSETILSSKVPFGHHFMSDAMKPSISKDHHLGSVNSSLVNPYLTPPLSSIFPSCVTHPSRLSAWSYPLIKAGPTRLPHIYNALTR